MDKFVKYAVLFLLLCGSAVGMQKKNAEDDPFALFKLPTQKATVHYIKKAGKEYVYIKGKDLKDYTVLTNTDGVSVNVRQHKIKGKVNLSKKSRYVENLKTAITEDGSKVDLRLKGKPGFKIYRRPSGLVLAMGPGYQEIAEDTLESLDSDVSKASAVDNELDNMLKDQAAATTPDVGGAPAPEAAIATAPAPAGGVAPVTKPTPADNNIDSLINNLETETVKEEIQPINKPVQTAKITTPQPVDNDLDRIISEADSDIATYEQNQVEAGLGRPAVLENIKIEKVSDKINLVIQTDKSVKYQQKEPRPGYNQVVLEIPNATMVKQISNIDTSSSDGLITSITPQQMTGPYKSIRVVVQLSKDIKPNLSQKGNIISLGFPLEAMEGGVANLSPDDIDDMEAARQLSRLSFEDYLAHSTNFYGRRMSIKFSKTKVTNIIDLIKEFSGINISVSEKVNNEVGINLKNVPWDQALITVLQSAQLGYIMQGSIIRVAPITDIRDERKLAAEAMEAQSNLEPLKIMVARLNYLNAKEVEDKLSAILSKRGKMSVDKDAKTLVLHDTSDVITKADKLLRAIDVKPMQVSIEANIVEANSTWLSSMGFAWATSSGDISFKSISGIGDISAAIGAASINGDVKVVSAPKISAIDRQMASILQGTQVAYKTTGQSANGENIDKIEFENIEVALNVTPRVTDNNEIILDVNVKREFPDYTLRLAKTLPPGVGIRKASSHLLLKDGDTAVIGGLYSLDNGDADAGVPLIKKIPLLGWFFGKSESKEVRSELIIFLKATIKKEDTLAKI